MSQGNQGWTDAAETFDWDSVDDAPPPCVDDGIYKAKFVKAEPRKTKGNEKNPPTPAINMTLEFIAPHGGSELGRFSKTAFDMFVFSQAAVWRVKGMAKRLNVNPPKSNSFDDLNGFGRDLIEAGEFYVRTKKELGKNGRWYATPQAYLTEEEAATAASTGNTGGATPAAEPVARRARRGAAAEPAAAQ